MIFLQRAGIAEGPGLPPSQLSATELDARRGERCHGISRRIHRRNSEDNSHDPLDNSLHRCRRGVAWFNLVVARWAYRDAREAVSNVCIVMFYFLGIRDSRRTSSVDRCIVIYGFVVGEEDSPAKL